MVPKSGNFKVLTILIQFTDVKFKDPQNVRNRFHNMYNQSGFTPEGGTVATGSVASYGTSSANLSFNNPTRFFTPATTPPNKGCSGANLSTPKDITQIVNGEKNVQFMFNPTINGVYKFCDNETYTINNVVDTAQLRVK